jgi:hypothetical protein
VPEKLAAILHRMVAKDRDARYAKPSQVADDLKSFCPGCDLAGLFTRAALGAGLPAPLKAPIARSAESPAVGRQSSSPGRPGGLAEGGVVRPAPGEQPLPNSPDRRPVRATPPAIPKPASPAGRGVDQGFDPYYKWLGIPPEEQPPNHYRLLGIRLFEEDRDVIQAAAERQTVYLRNVALGKHSIASKGRKTDCAWSVSSRRTRRRARPNW